LEDATICYDGTVRNSLGNLVQFVHGDDGMDGALLRSSITRYTPFQARNSNIITVSTLLAVACLVSFKSASTNCRLDLRS
jgi:hypothetical protein